MDTIPYKTVTRYLVVSLASGWRYQGRKYTETKRTRISLRAKKGTLGWNEIAFPVNIQIPLLNEVENEPVEVKIPPLKQGDVIAHILSGAED